MDAAAEAKLQDLLYQYTSADITLNQYKSAVGAMYNSSPRQIAGVEAQEWIAAATNDQNSELRRQGEESKAAQQQQQSQQGEPSGQSQGGYEGQGQGQGAGYGGYQGYGGDSSGGGNVGAGQAGTQGTGAGASAGAGFGQGTAFGSGQGQGLTITAPSNQGLALYGTGIVGGSSLGDVGGGTTVVTAGQGGSVPGDSGTTGGAGTGNPQGNYGWQSQGGFSDQPEIKRWLKRDAHYVDPTVVRAPTKGPNLKYKLYPCAKCAFFFTPAIINVNDPTSYFGKCAVVGKDAERSISQNATCPMWRSAKSPLKGIRPIPTTDNMYTPINTKIGRRIADLLYR